MLGFARSLGWAVPRPAPRFGHGASAPLLRPDDVTVHLVGRCDVSQQNTHTGRLTEEMLDAAIAEAVRLARAGGARRARGRAGRPRGSVGAAGGVRGAAIAAAVRRARAG